MDLDLSHCANCSIIGLVDHKTQSIYALKGVIEVKDGAGKIVCFAESVMRLDYMEVKAKSNE